MKLFYVSHRRIVALGYHVHCDTNKMMQNLFITLDSRYEVTFAELHGYVSHCQPVLTQSFHGPLG